MRCAYVKRVLTDEHRRLLLETYESVIPNEWHPSDHLALRAGFHLLRSGSTSGADCAEYQKKKKEEEEEEEEEEEAAPSTSTFISTASGK